jgi:hypothetical protein
LITNCRSFLSNRPMRPSTLSRKLDFEVAMDVLENGRRGYLPF